MYVTQNVPRTTTSKKTKNRSITSWLWRSVWHCDCQFHKHKTDFILKGQFQQYIRNTYDLLSQSGCIFSACKLVQVTVDIKGDKEYMGISACNLHIWPSGPVFLSFFGVGSHLPLSKSCSEIMLHCRGSAVLQSKVVWESTKENLSRGKAYNVLATLGYPATIAVPGDEPWLAQLQPSLTHFSLIHFKD